MGRRWATRIAIGLAALALPASAGARDTIVRSFDDTPLVTHFYPGKGATAKRQAPTILVGPGWSMSGDTQTEGGDGVSGFFGVPAISFFIDHGYNILTWDPRGFGGSGGTVQVDDPDFEGRDVSALIDFVAKQPEAQLDGKGDPRVGMAGASYGGGIQMVAAGQDRRIDAIAPTIAWNSLTTSLFQDDAVKFGWGGLLVGLGVEGATLPGVTSPAGPQPGSQDPHFYSTFVDGAATGHASAEDKAFFADNGPDFLLKRIKAPTLLIQGTVDTLFPLDEAIRNYRTLNNNTVRRGQKHARTGLPVKMIWFCGGHGVCFTGNGPDGYVDKRELAWFDRFLREDRTVETGPRFAWIADDNVLRTSRRFPGEGDGALHGSGSGTLPLAAGPSGGGGAIFATPSPIAVNVPIPGPDHAANVLGGPNLKLTYSGAAAPAKTFTYAQIVNPRNNQVLGNITTPIPLTLDGEEHSISRKLEWTAARAPKGGGYTLQLTPTSTVYDIQRSAGEVDFSKIDITMPLRSPVHHAPRGHGRG
jgi:ABC-2 type transport system ATP-binding protein